MPKSLGLNQEGNARQPWDMTSKIFHKFNPQSNTFSSFINPFRQKPRCMVIEIPLLLLLLSPTLKHLLWPGNRKCHIRVISGLSEGQGSKTSKSSKHLASPLSYRKRILFYSFLYHCPSKASFNGHSKYMVGVIVCISCLALFGNSYQNMFHPLLQSLSFNLWQGRTQMPLKLARK